MVRFQKIGLLFVLLFVTTIVHAQEQINGLYYQINNEKGTAYVCRVPDISDAIPPYSGAIEIPASVTWPGTENIYSVDSISTSAFEGSIGLDSISIPASVKSIGKNAFKGCSSLKKANFASVKYLCDIKFGNKEANPLSQSNSLYIGGTPKTQVTEQDLNGVSVIRGYAFAGGSQITLIELSGNNIDSIGNDAFNGCKNYQLYYTNIGQMLSIGYGDGVSNPMTNAGSVNVKSAEDISSGEIHINQKVKANAFKGAKWLKGVSFGSDATSIGKYAFYSCVELSSITLPTTLGSIGYGAFQNCKKLTSIVIPASVGSVGEYAFSGCVLLTDVDIKASSIVTVPKGLFSGCTSLTNVKLHEFINTIGEETFKGCTSLTGLPSGKRLKTISKNAFNGCNGIKSLVIPDSITLIKETAFSSCANLTDITISERIKETEETSLTIQGKAFSGSNSLNIYSYALYPPVAADDAFEGYTNIQLFCTADGVPSYQETTPWSGFTPTAFTQHTITYKIDGVQYEEPKSQYVGKETPSVTTTPTRENWVFAGWHETIPALMPNEDLVINGHFTKEYIVDGVKYLLRSDTKEARVIGNDNPVSVTINPSIEFESNNYTIVAIEARAFKGAESLTTVDLSKATNLTSIGNAIFADCSLLNSVSLPATLIEITDSMFYECM